MILYQRERFRMLILQQQTIIHQYTPSISFAPSHPMRFGWLLPSLCLADCGNQLPQPPRWRLAGQCQPHAARPVRWHARLPHRLGCSPVDLSHCIWECCCAQPLLCSGRGPLVYKLQLHCAAACGASLRRCIGTRRLLLPVFSWGWAPASLCRASLPAPKLLKPRTSQLTGPS